jgi:hypothetical protein
VSVKGKRAVQLARRRSDGANEGEDTRAIVERTEADK